MYKEMYKELYKDIFNVKFLVILVIFLAGLYFYVYYSSNPLLLESLTTMNGELRCPKVLMQKDSKYYLYNSNIAEVPGVNPIMFNNLEEYTEFLDWQRGAGIRCPVLYLQNTYDAQGNRVYKARPSVSEAQGGLPHMVCYLRIIMCCLREQPTRLRRLKCRMNICFLVITQWTLIGGELITRNP